MSDGDNKGQMPPGGEPEGNGNEEALNTGKPAVAAAPGKMLFVLIFAGVFIFIVMRSLFFGGTPAPEKPPEHHKETVVDAPKNPVDAGITGSAGLPAPPPDALAPPTITQGTGTTAAFNPPPPSLPPPPPSITAPPVPEVHTIGAPTNDVLQARIRSPMIVSAGTPHFNVPKLPGKALAGNDPNSAFAQGVAMTDADRVEATKLSDLNITLAQGKIIQAVLESAIDSDLPGPIRAIVSHDTYAESGREILIPKGSRLIGTYNSAIKRGQARIFIVWTRVIRPDGVDVAINSPGVDALGRAGLAGDLDNKYFEAFSAALLTSAIDIGVAYAGDKIVGNDQTTQSTSTAGATTTTTGTAGSAGVTQAVQNIGSVGQTIVASAVNLQPTISVDQGTLVNVFVNRDVVFPVSVTKQSKIIE